MKSFVLCLSLLVLVPLWAMAKKDLSLKTETTNGVKVVVFRKAGDTTSTNKVKSTELDNGKDESAKKLKKKLNIKE